MSRGSGPLGLRAPTACLAGAALLGVALVRCSSAPGAPGPGPAGTSDGGGEAANPGGDGDDGVNGCFQDADGLTGGSYTIALTVDDTGFSKTVLNTQNDATVTLTLTNNGTTPHGFTLDCVSVLPEFPGLPAGCASMSCFPASATIAPLAPGASVTVTFFTPTPDNLIYPFHSNAPADATVPGLNQGQWSIM